MMGATKYCVYNQTRDSFLSLAVTGADASSELLRSLWRQFANRTDVELWVRPLQKPYPAGGRVFADLVYLARPQPPSGGPGRGADLFGWHATAAGVPQAS